MIKECKLINKETTIEHIFNYLSQRYEFTIIKELGKGGFGCVKEIKIRNHKSALKVQYFPIGSEEQLKKKKKYFDREATLSQHFKHKNIVSTNNIFSLTIDNKYVSGIIMEKCSKNTLMNLIKICNKGNFFHSILFNHFTFLPYFFYFSENFCKYFFEQTLCGLEYIHRSGCCHFDMKAENILLTHDYIVKLSDFGLTGVSNTSKLSKGTIGYMGLEYYENKNDAKYGEGVDIFPLGVILYLLFFKENLINTDKLSSINEKILKNIIEQRIILIEKNENISEKMKRVLIKMLNDDHRKRPSVYELMNDEWLKEGREERKQIFDTNPCELEKILIELQKSDITFLRKGNQRKGNNRKYTFKSN